MVGGYREAIGRLRGTGRACRDHPRQGVAFTAYCNQGFEGHFREGRRWRASRLRRRMKTRATVKLRPRKLKERRIHPIPTFGVLGGVAGLAGSISGFWFGSRRTSDGEAPSAQRANGCLRLTTVGTGRSDADIGVVASIKPKATITKLIHHGCLPANKT